MDANTELPVEEEIVDSGTQPVGQEPPKQAEPTPAARPTAEQQLEARRQQLLEQSAAQDRQRAEKAERELAQARLSSADNQYHMLRTAVEQRNSDMALAKREYADAFQRGDADAVAAAQERMATIAAERAQFTAYLAQAEEQRKQPQPQQQRQVEQQADPVERYLASIQDPRARDWLRSHPECLPGGPLHNRVQAAHYDAVDRGLAMGSPKYWEHIEVATGYRDPAAESDPAPAPQSLRRQSMSAAAPPSRSAPNMNGTRNNGKVQLTAREKQTARELDMTDDEYAKYKGQLIEDGSYYSFDPRRH